MVLVVSGRVVLRSCSMPYTPSPVSSGNTEGHTGYGSRTAAWNVVKNDQDFGFGSVQASRTSFEWTFYRASDGAVLDHVVLTK